MPATANGGKRAEKKATINVRVVPSVKAEAEELFADLGINLTDAINIFLRQSIQYGGLPFEVRRSIPNSATQAALREADAIAGDPGIKGYSSAGELLSALDAE